MYEKIISDLRECANFNYCSECHAENCVNNNLDRKECVFSLAANIIEALEKENMNLQKKVSSLSKELSEVSSELSWTKYPEGMGR